MGFADTFRDFYESLTFSNELHAEAPEKESQDEQGGEEGEDKGEEDKEKEDGEAEGGDGDEGESKDEGGEEEEEEEEEEEDEPVDLKPQLEAGTSLCHIMRISYARFHTQCHGTFKRIS